MSFPEDLASRGITGHTSHTSSAAPRPRKVAETLTSVIPASKASQPIITGPTQDLRSPTTSHLQQLSPSEEAPQSNAGNTPGAGRRARFTERPHESVYIGRTQASVIARTGFGHDYNTDGEPLDPKAADAFYSPANLHPHDGRVTEAMRPSPAAPTRSAMKKPQGEQQQQLSAQKPIPEQLPQQTTSRHDPVSEVLEYSKPNPPTKDVDVITERRRQAAIQAVEETDAKQQRRTPIYGHRHTTSPGFMTAPRQRKHPSLDRADALRISPAQQAATEKIINALEATEVGSQFIGQLTTAAFRAKIIAFLQQNPELSETPMENLSFYCKTNRTTKEITSITIQFPEKQELPIATANEPGESETYRWEINLKENKLVIPVFSI